MFKPMSTPLLTVALLTAVGVASAQAQTATPSGNTHHDNPSIAMQTTARMPQPRMRVWRRPTHRRHGRCSPA